MTARAVVTAWIAAAALLAATVAMLLASAARAPVVFHGAKVALIGSSLTRVGFPQGPEEPQGLLDDGRDHWRVGLSSITEEETTELVQHAIEEHAATVLIEANALLFDPAKTQASGRCDQPARELRWRMEALQLTVTDAYVALTDRAGRLDERTLPGEREHGFSILPASARAIYPLALRGPCHLDALRTLATAARAQGSGLVLMLLPRSQVAEQLLGPEQRRQLDQLARGLAKTLGARLFEPAGPWPDSDYTDQEHLGSAGRTHLLAALRQWWQQGS